MTIFIKIMELLIGMLIVFAIGALIGKLFKLDEFFNKKKK